MRKTCKRKHWALINPITHAILGACVTDDKALSDLHLRELSALEAITHGKGGLQEWHDLSAALNLCEQAAHEGIGPEALPACKTAQNALIEAAYRFESTGVMGLSGEGITALRDVIAYHHLQRSSISRSQYEEIIRLTQIKIKNKAKGVVQI